jgi:hypothetical protein
MSLTGSGIIGAIAGWSVLRVIELWRTGKNTAYRVGLNLAKGLFFGAVMWVFLPPAMWPPVPTPERFRMASTSIPYYIAISLAMSALWVVERRFSELAISSSDANAVKAYLSLRSLAQSLVSLASAILVLGIISLAIRNALFRALNPTCGIAPESLLYEGLIYTVLLAVAYIPIHARFNAVGESVLDQLLKDVPMDGATNVQNWLKVKADIENLLELRTYEWKAFGPGLAVIAPLLTGFVTKGIERLSG